MKLDTSWRQIRQLPSQTRRHQKLDELFAAITEISDLLTRETVCQNPLDSGRFNDIGLEAAGPVRVRVYVSEEEGAVPAEAAEPFFNGLEEHLHSHLEQLDGHDQVSERLLRAPCRFVLIEDFNTRGLVGDVRRQPEEVKEDDNRRQDYFWFLKAEGMSGKGHDSLGNHGVGKWVLNAASDASAFFALSIREDEEAPEILVGRSLYMPHSVGGEYYLPDGWWASWEGEGHSAIQVPLVKEDVLADFRETWGVTRKHERGLSVVIPYADEDIEARAIIRAVLSNFVRPILEGRLVVSVESPSVEEVTIDAVSLDPLSEEFFSRQELEDQLGRTHLMRSTLSKTDTPDVIAGTPATGREPKFPAFLSEEQMELIRTKLGGGEGVLVRFPMYCEPLDTDEEPTWTSFDVLIERHASKGWADYYRGGMRIPLVKGNKMLNGYRALVSIDEPVAARMFGGAENPAHTNWNPYLRRFSHRYRFGSRWITLVKHAPESIVNAIAGMNEEDELIFADLLPDLTPTDEGRDRGSRRPKRKKRRDIPDPPPLPASKFVRGKIDTSDGVGVSVRLSERGIEEGVAALSASFAYDVETGDPFGRWSTWDFDLSDLEVNVAGGQAGISGNKIHVTISDPADFRLSVTGFDRNRDLKLNLREAKS